MLGSANEARKCIEDHQQLRQLPTSGHGWIGLGHLQPAPLRRAGLALQLKISRQHFPVTQRRGQGTNR